MHTTVNPADVVPSVSIENFIAQRESIQQRITQAIALLHEAAEIAAAANLTARGGYGGFADFLTTQRHHRMLLLDEDALTRIGKRVDAAAWDALMRQSGLVSLMDAKARDEWCVKIDQCDTPPLTFEHIRTTFEALHASRAAMFERGVINCFKALSWCYKTNQPFAFGKRIIKRMGYGGSHFDHRPMNELTDLQRIFLVLEDKPEEDHRASLATRLGDAVRAATQGHYIMRPGTHDDTYVSFRWFANGNAHITFKRPDFVGKMNAILARHYPGALPYDRHA